VTALISTDVSRGNPNGMAQQTTTIKNRLDVVFEVDLVA